MLDTLSTYRTAFNDAVNDKLINGLFDIPLEEHVKEIISSLETCCSGIKIISMEYHADEHNIHMNDHIIKREKKIKKKDKCKHKFINDDRVGRLSIVVDITGVDDDNKERPIVTRRIKRDILIPLVDKHGRYTLKGKKCYMIYQLVENSTYTTTKGLVGKSLLAIDIERSLMKGIEDIEGNTYELPIYHVKIFKNLINIMIIMSHNGLINALEFLGVIDIISIVEEIDHIDMQDNLIFKINKKLFILVNRNIFNKYMYVQGILAMILEMCNNRFSIEDIYDGEMWIKKLHKSGKLEKGISQLIFCDRMIDETSARVLGINKYNKKDIYSFLRWMLLHYNELRKKDNLSLTSKRLRKNEYIASLLNMEFTRRLNRVLLEVQNGVVTLRNLEDLFKFPGSILKEKMYSSGILRYDDIINSMSVVSKTRYTLKGPHSQGNKNKKSMSVSSRGLHPSMIGYKELLVCGHSDPGTTGNMSMYCDLKSLYFSNNEEPEDKLFQLQKDIDLEFERLGRHRISFNVSSAEELYEVLNKLNSIGMNVKLYSSSTTGVDAEVLELDTEDGGNIELTPELIEED